MTKQHANVATAWSCRHPPSSSARRGIDTAAYRVTKDGSEVALSSREFRLMQCLAENRDRVVPLTELVHVTHDLDTDAQDAGSLIRPLVRSVRRKLGYGPGEWGCIRSVRGVGYSMVGSDA